MMLSVLAVLSVACRDTGTKKPTAMESADDLIQAHLEAIGGLDSWKAIRTLTYRGTYAEGGSRQSHRFDRKRPGWIRITTNYDDETGAFGYAEGFDGAAWEFNSGVPVRVTGMPAKALRNAAAFDPPFLDDALRGDRAQLVGRDTLVGQDVYHLRTDPADGRRTDHYFDASSLMHVMSLSQAPMHGEGKTLEILSINSDFRQVGGVLLAHRHVQQELSSGEILSTLTWDRIEANVEIPDAWFSPPPAPEAERYAEFRAAALDGRLDELSSLYVSYRELADAQHNQRLENELNTLGYELLSHERYVDAITVFRLALAKYPLSANLHDSLGEALIRAGHRRKAIESYRKSYELDPTNNNALEVIEKMERDSADGSLQMDLEDAPHFSQ